MFMEIALPAPDPIPLPGPDWLFKILLIVTFVLHLIAMNGVLGGGVIAAAARLRANGHDDRRRLAGDLAMLIPSLLAAAINLGVAVLLFTQVLYGQALYTSSILMAWPWLGALVLVVLGYYGFYRAAFQAKNTGHTPAVILTGSALLFVLIAFLFTNNMTLALSPEKWAARYHADPSGWNLNLDEVSLIPRYLHFLVAAVAAGGLLVVLLGLARRRQDADRARFLVAHGGRWFMFATMLQFLIGTWFLLSLPREKMLLFMGKNMPATIYFTVGIIGSVLAIVFMARAIRAENPRGKAVAAMVTTLMVIVVMVLMRDTLRVAYLEPYIRPREFAVNTQWGPLLLFIGLFGLGIAVWVWMVVLYRKGIGNKGEEGTQGPRDPGTQG